MSVPAWVEQGSGDTAVLMLHGVGGGKAAFADLMTPLARAGYRALSWDMPGYGDSASIAPFDNPGLARALERLIDRVAARRTVLLGHSMGGMVAQEAAALFPAKIDGFIFSATSPAFGKPGGDWQNAFLAARFAPLDAGCGMAGLAPELVAQMVGPDTTPAVIAAAAALMARVPEATYRAALSAIVAFDRRENLASIKAPVLCIAGEHDRNAAPLVMEKMAARIPGAEYVRLPGAGHLANMEQPAAFNAVVLDFLRRHFPPA